MKIKVINEKQKSYFGIIISSILIIGFSLISVSISAQVSINTTGVAPHSSAMLDVVSTNKGVLLPRVTLTGTGHVSSVTSAAEGLIVYNEATAGDVTPGYYWWNSSEWVRFGSDSGGGCTLDQAYDFGGAGAGRTITADNGAVSVTTGTASGVGLLATHTGNGAALGAVNNSTTSQYSAFEAVSKSQQGTFANPKGAVLGTYSGTGDWSAGIMGQNTNPTNGIDAHGVIGIASGNTSAGIYGSNANGYGIQGNALYGVFGVANSTSGGGVVGQLDGALGFTQAGYLGAYRNGQEYAVYADNDILFEGLLYGNPGSGNTLLLNATTGSGVFLNDLTIGGWLSKGGGSFKIDHPLDPENKYLYHSFVESPDMMNIYNGIAVFDTEGFVKVTLPEYFEALNKDFRYQLSAIGAPMPNLYVAEKVNGNTFVIGGGEPGKEVSWEITGVRQDKYANSNRMIDEVEKEDYNKGRYIHPDLFGAPASKRIHLRDPNEKPAENNDSERINKKPLDKDVKVNSLLDK